MTNNELLFWTHDRTAAELGISPTTLYVWVNAGTGPPSYKLGRLRRYIPAEVRVWVAALADRYP